MKKFSIASGVSCSQCGMRVQVVWARSLEEAWAGAGVCEACHHAGEEKHEPDMVAAKAEPAADMDSVAGEGDGEEAVQSMKRGRRAKSRSMPAEAVFDEDSE